MGMWLVNDAGMFDGFRWCLHHQITLGHHNGMKIQKVWQSRWCAKLAGDQMVIINILSPRCVKSRICYEMMWQVMSTTLPRNTFACLESLKIATQIAMVFRGVYLAKAFSKIWMWLVKPQPGSSTEWQGSGCRECQNGHHYIMGQWVCQCHVNELLFIVWKRHVHRWKPHDPPAQG